MNQAQHNLRERHVMILDEETRTAFILEAAAYSIGRDDTSAIVLKDSSISRQHALLLRLPELSKHHYKYRLVDGNIGGKPSGNGTFVNGKPCTSEALKDGDIITFGKGVRAKYHIMSGEEEETTPDFLKAVQFHSIKATILNSKETFVGEAFNIHELERDYLEQENTVLGTSTPAALNISHLHSTSRKLQESSNPSQRDVREEVYSTTSPQTLIRKILQLLGF